MGDMNGKGAFTHTSYNDFEIVAANLFDDDPRRVSDRILCYGLFVDPPLGRVGMTEQQARDSGRRVLIGKRMMTNVGRAKERSETDGFIKILVDADSKEILGAAILGVVVVHGALELGIAAPVAERRLRHAAAPLTIRDLPDCARVAVSSVEFVGPAIEIGRASRAVVAGPVPLERRVDAFIVASHQRLGGTLVAGAIATGTINRIASRFQTGRLKLGTANHGAVVTFCMVTSVGAVQFCRLPGSNAAWVVALNPLRSRPIAVR